MIEGTYDKPTKPGRYAVCSPSGVWEFSVFCCMDGEIEDEFGIGPDEYELGWFFVGPLSDPPEVKRDRD